MASDKHQTDRDQVFADRTGLRHWVWPLIGLVSLFLILLWVFDFLFRIYNLQALPNDGTKGNDRGGDTVAVGPDNATFRMLGLAPTIAPECKARPADSGPETGLVFGYLPWGDPLALAGLRNRCRHLDGLFYEAFTFSASDGGVSDLFQQREPFILRDLVDGKSSSHPPTTYPILRPRNPALNNGTSKVFADPVLTEIFVRDLGLIAEQTDATGLCLDLSELPGIAPAKLSQFLEVWKSVPEMASRETCVVGTADAGYWADPAVVERLDRVVIKGFRTTAEPSDLPAPQPWFQDVMVQARQHIPTEKLVVALGTFGTSWQSGRARPKMVSFAEAMLHSHRLGGQIGFSADAANTRVRFLDEARRLNQIWLLDAASFYNQTQFLSAGQNLAVWPLGYEDPAVWTLVNQSKTDPVAILNAPVDLTDYVAVTGDGIFAVRNSVAIEGHRRATLDATTGGLVSLDYDRMPRPAELTMNGDLPQPGLVLTFSGLPPSEVSQTLLARLDRLGIEATFFLTPFELLEFDPVLADIKQAGHSIGARLQIRRTSSPFSAMVAELSSNFTQHLLAYLTGQRTAFVHVHPKRPELPRDQFDMEAFGILQQNGYLAVVADIEPFHGTFDQDRLIRRVRAAALRQRTTVLELDLTSGNAEAIVASLPDVIGLLRNDGLVFASLSDLAAQNVADVSPDFVSSAPGRDAITYAVLNFWHVKLTIVFLVLLIAAAIRSLIYLVLAFLRRPPPPPKGEFRPGVTVLVPAYNESKVIEQCVRSILRSDYPDIKVIVIDDGSRDGTASIVRQHFSTDPRVKLITQKNAGKWAAQNNGFIHTDTPIFIGIDADTVIRPDAISWLVQPFHDERVGAVAGFVEVGNRRNLLTACQTLEYLVSQSVSRRAFETFNGILVVPGAIGAWRTDAVRKAGLYSGNTITEDADLTIAVHRAGYHVRFQENARALTEAPETVGPFLVQRLRWILGMLQTSWKHRRAITERRPVGYISIIDAIWFSLLTSLLSPVVDILLIGLIVKGIISLATTGAVALSALPLTVVGSYLLLVAIDGLNTLAAFRFERRVDLKLLLLVPFLRFGYRQLIYISSIRAMWRALTGQLSSWKKLRRTASAAFTMRDR